jgi:hypothetical protein
MLFFGPFSRVGRGFADFGFDLEVGSEGVSRALSSALLRRVKGHSVGGAEKQAYGPTTLRAST